MVKIFTAQSTHRQKSVCAGLIKFHESPKPGDAGGGDTCGNCGEGADAAVLCPSFYRADVVHNPVGLETWWARQSLRIIGWLQKRRARKLVFET